MKEIVIISGKGGTGKTSVASAMAYLKKDELVLADCDVDAADLHLIMQPQNHSEDDYYSGIKAVIDTGACTNCGICAQICRFDAIEVKDGSHHVVTLDCEGCGYCFLRCPVNAISIPTQNVGKVYLADTRLGIPMAHARLKIGADNSGKLVARVKRDARKLASEKEKALILVDGSPGIGCPVISSLSGADYVVLVTEPTRSGLSDLTRVWDLARRFDLKTGCIINKADLNPEVRDEIMEFLADKGIKLLAQLPYHDDFTQAIINGKALMELNPEPWNLVFDQIWTNLLKEL
ncbi:MAG: ATP-binding protein [Candidatus Cloacimonadaceae bacterium]